MTVCIIKGLLLSASIILSAILWANLQAKVISKIRANKNIVKNITKSGTFTQSIGTQAEFIIVQKSLFCTK